jgi:hypothetical protein
MVIGGSLSTALEPDGIIRTAVDRSTGCFLDRPDLGTGTGGIYSVSSVVAGPLPLEALVKRVELISICATIAFTDEGECCPVFVKGLTQFKCILDSAVNRPVPLIGC